MSEKAESGLEVVAWAHPDYCDVITDSPTRTIEWERSGVSPIPLVRQSDAERALQLKHEAHRKTWRQLEQVTGLLRGILNTARGSSGRIIIEVDEEADIRAALSQQADPRCEYCDGTGDVHRADGEWLGECKECDASEPAPAQDEREFDSRCLDPLLRQYCHNDGSPGFVFAYEAKGTEQLVDRMRAALATRPAQTEQQPEPLPYWEPCNPGCDPEFNGTRSRHCAELCHGARAALSPTPSPAMEAKEEL